MCDWRLYYPLIFSDIVGRLHYCLTFRERVDYNMESDESAFGRTEIQYDFQILGTI